jgi:hypothetical protein
VAEVILEQCPLVLVALEALEEAKEAAAEEASVEALKEVSMADEAEVVSVEASAAAAVEVASEVAATLAPEAAAIETASEEHPMEPHLVLDSKGETEAATEATGATEASLVVGMSLEVVDAHMKTDLVATEMAADMAIVTAATVATEVIVVTVAIVVTVVTVATEVIVATEVTVATVTAKDARLAVTRNPLAAAEKVGIGKGTMIGLAMMTAGSEDTKVVATKIPGSCAATKLDGRCKSTNFDAWWVSYLLDEFLSHSFFHLSWVRSLLSATKLFSDFRSPRITPQIHLILSRLF